MYASFICFHSIHPAHTCPGVCLQLQVLQRYLVAVTGQKVEFLESTSRAARAAAIAAKQPVPAKQPVAFGRSNSVVIKQDLKKPTPPPQRPPWLRTGDDKGVVTPSAIKATPPDRVVSAVSYFKKKVPVVKSNSRRSFVHTRYDDLSTSEEEEEDEEEREGQGGDAPGEMVSLITLYVCLQYSLLLDDVLLCYYHLAARACMGRWRRAGGQEAR